VRRFLKKSAEAIHPSPGDRHQTPYFAIIILIDTQNPFSYASRKKGQIC
jgi:hypothetical protein